MKADTTTIEAVNNVNIETNVNTLYFHKHYITEIEKYYKMRH